MVLSHLHFQAGEEDKKESELTESRKYKKFYKIWFNMVKHFQFKLFNVLNDLYFLHIRIVFNTHSEVIICSVMSELNENPLCMENT